MNAIEEAKQFDLVRDLIESVLGGPDMDEGLGVRCDESYALDGYNITRAHAEAVRFVLEKIEKLEEAPDAVVPS